jgi:two-component system OmpR family response regulator
MRRRIAIVEDEAVIRANYADVLGRHGYEVAAFGDRASALAALRSRLPDLVLLDIGLGDDVDGGFKLCQELRAMSSTLPVIFLTRADLAGAPAPADSVIERGPLTLDLNRFTVAWRDATVDLTLTEFWLVHALAKFPGHVKNRDQLMGEAHVVVDDSTITSHIKRIRRKFVAIDAEFDCIDTVYGLGYRWKAPD